VAVGFDENKNFIIRNSWNTNWGMKGYAVLSGNPISVDCRDAY
jgi:C1A family cysteine protease